MTDHCPDASAQLPLCQLILTPTDPNVQSQLRSAYRLGLGLTHPPQWFIVTCLLYSGIFSQSMFIAFLFFLWGTSITPMLSVPLLLLWYIARPHYYLCDWYPLCLDACCTLWNMSNALHCTYNLFDFSFCCVICKNWFFNKKKNELEGWKSLLGGGSRIRWPAKMKAKIYLLWALRPH